MPLSLDGRPSEEQAVKVICAALDEGMDLLDTADVYCIDNDDMGHNERLIARALKEWKGDTSKIVVATKGGLERPDGNWVSNAAPLRLRKSCEDSLRALDVDAISLYQLHAPDPKVPYTESVGELGRLQQEGKILHVGLSNVNVAGIRIAESLVTVTSVQNRCNPFVRDAWHHGIIDYCEKKGIAFIAYSPMGGRHGIGRVKRDPVLNRVGQALGLTPSQVVLAWLLDRSPVMICIPGASRVTSVLGSSAAMGVSLGSELMAELDRAFPCRLGARPDPAPTARSHQ